MQQLKIQQICVLDWRSTAKQHRYNKKIFFKQKHRSSPSDKHQTDDQSDLIILGCSAVEEENSIHKWHDSQIGWVNELLGWHWFILVYLQDQENEEQRYTLCCRFGGNQG